MTTASSSCTPSSRSPRRTKTCRQQTLARPGSVAARFAERARKASTAVGLGYIRSSVFVSGMCHGRGGRADLRAKHPTRVRASESEPPLGLENSKLRVAAAVLLKQKTHRFRKSEAVYIAAASVREGGKRETRELRYAIPDRQWRHLLLVSSFLSLSLGQWDKSRRVFSFVL
jgi:hypothetical protein